jgi:hypothetical protein
MLDSAVAACSDPRKRGQLLADPPATYDTDAVAFADAVDELEAGQGPGGAGGRGKRGRGSSQRAGASGGGGSFLGSLVGFGQAVAAAVGGAAVTAAAPVPVVPGARTDWDLLRADLASLRAGVDLNVLAQLPNLRAVRRYLAERLVEHECEGVYGVAGRIRSGLVW